MNNNYCRPGLSPNLKQKPKIYEVIIKVKDWLKPYWYFIRDLTKPLRLVLIKLIINLPVSSEVIGPPKGFYKSTQDWIASCDLSQLANKEITYTEVHPGYQIVRSKPKTLEPHIHWKFQQEYQHQSPPVFVAVLPEGRVWGKNGTVITPDDKVLADVSVEHGVEIPGTRSIHLQWKLPAVYQVDGTVAVLSTAGSDGYYHWLFDTLPRIEILRRSGIPLDSIDKFIVNSYSLPFQQETLATLGIPATKIIESCHYPHVKASRLVVPSLPGYVGNMPDWACKFLKQEFLPDRIVERSHKSERLYISRDMAKGRKIVNSHEVTNFLSKLGFKCVVLESLSIAETALLFSAAEVVLAPHGAGLSNLVFCQPGTKVIEIFSPNYVNVLYWSLSNEMNLEYYYLLGEGKRPSEYFDPNKVRENILVNLDSLSNLMKLADLK